jgi:hypothetical protein
MARCSALKDGVNISRVMAAIGSRQEQRAFIPIYKTAD